MKENESDFWEKVIGVCLIALISLIGAYLLQVFASGILKP